MSIEAITDEQLFMTPLSPTGSLLRGWRPSLAVLFHQFRGSSEREYLVKEDFHEVFLDASQLDKAFNELDSDGDGRITLDEFMAGFATFLRQAQTSSALANNNNLGVDPNTEELLKRGGSSRRSVRRRPIPEIFFETVEATPADDDSAVQKPTDTFKRSLKPLATRTQESIEQLWCRLNDSNPELVCDFEDFICEMSTEVDSAQKALKKHREATTKEAYELDEEIERMQNHTRSQLEQETAILREKAYSNQSKLEVQLMEKEHELTEIKSKLELLESEIVASKQSQTELQQRYESAFDEKDELIQRLDQSESLLKESQEAIEEIRRERDEKMTRLIEERESKEATLVQMESTYTKEIRELKDMLSSVVQQQEMQQQQQERLQHKLRHHNSDEDYQGIRPDLLSTHRGDLGRESPCSLLDEIVETEGTTSPVLRDTMLHVRPPILNVPIDSDFQSVPSSTSLKDLDHLDLATTPSSELRPILQPSNHSNVVHLRPKSGNGRRGRPTSLYAGEPNAGNLDLNWPPAHWTVPPQEWLATIAAGTVTDTNTNTANLSPEDTILPPPPPPNPSPYTSSLEEIRRNDCRRKYNDPEMCKALDFVESMVVQPDVTYKVLIVGNPHVGKSCFLTRLCTNMFTTRYASTIGVDFYSRALTLDNTTVALQFWDTAGQERFQSVTRAYYRGADGVILMYDITCEESFIAVRKWINSMQENMDKLPTCLLLVGNKVDLDEQGKREVLPETGETFAKIYGARFVETSAKTGYSVTNACLTLVNNLLTEATVKENGQKLTVAPGDTKSQCSC